MTIITGSAMVEGERIDGKIEIWTPEKKDSKTVWVLAFEHEHGIPEPPVFRLGGMVKGKKPPYWFKSFVSGVLPNWNRVVTLTSDLDACYVSNIFNERWSYVSACSACEGSGHTEIEITNRS